MYVCIDACMYVRTYICMYVCMFICSSVCPSVRLSVHLPGAGLPQPVLLLPLFTTSCWLECMQLAYKSSSFASPSPPRRTPDGCVLICRSDVCPSSSASRNFNIISLVTGTHL